MAPLSTLSNKPRGPAYSLGGRLKSVEAGMSPGPGSPLNSTRHPPPLPRLNPRPSHSPHKIVCREPRHCCSPHKPSYCSLRTRVYEFCHALPPHPAGPGTRTSRWPCRSPPQTVRASARRGSSWHRRALFSPPSMTFTPPEERAPPSSTLALQ